MMQIRHRFGRTLGSAWRALLLCIAKMCFKQSMTKLTQFEANRVWLAPMSGSTDAAFRRQVVKFGCRSVVSEMVASDALTAERPDVVRRTCRHDGDGDWIVQLAARRPEDMRAASLKLVEFGVDVIDINMGCPSRQVTGGKSGSALMREPELALEIVDAALEGAGQRPVTLKMRLGWDETMLNAPQLAREAEKRGIRMITVHGRTRCQFYKGSADWAAINATVQAVDIPVIANGDIVDIESAELALKQSKAHGIMIGRGAMGRPWLPAWMEQTLQHAEAVWPNLETQFESLVEQILDSQALYGEVLGLKMVRKHLSAAIDTVELSMDPAFRRALRSRLCQIEDSNQLIKELERVYLSPGLEQAA